MGYLYQDGSVFSSARNKNGKPITDVEVKGSTVKDVFTGSANVTKTYTDPMDTFGIKNTGTASLTFSINGLSIPVEAGEAYENDFDPFTTVTVTATSTFKAQVKGKGASVVIDTTAPNNVPSPINVTNLAGTSLTLSWTASNSPDVAGYDVYKGSTKLGSVTGTTYNVTGLSPSTTYTFTIKAKDGSGNIASGTQVQATTTAAADTTAPNPVTNLTAGTVTSSSIPVSWTLSSSNDVANYEVAYSSNGGVNYTVASALVNASSTSYTISGLTANQAYVVRVVAIDGAGNRSTPVTVNATTSAAADTTPPNNVTNLTYANVTSSSLTLNWTASTSSDIASYDVYNGATLLGNTASTTFNVTGLSASTQYTFTVKAKDSSGNVASGTSVTVTTSAPALTDTAAPVVRASVPSGNYSVAQSVALLSEAGISKYYTTDGSDPVYPISGTTQVYNGPIPISATKTLKYFGRDAAGNSSPIRSKTYNVITAINGLTTNVLTNNSGTVIHPDFHHGSVKIKVDGNNPKFFLAVCDDGNVKYGVWCDGTNIKTGWVDNGVLRKEFSSQAKPTGDFYVEIYVPTTFTVGNYDQLKGYLHGYTWSASGSKPGGSPNIAGKIDSPTTKWAASTAKSLNNTIIPVTANGYYYKCTTAGTTGTTEPTWTTTEGNTVTDGTAVWTAYKIPTQISTPTVSAYSLDGSTVNITEVHIGDGYNEIHPLRGKANFVGRWYNTISYSNTGASLGEEMATPNEGSEIYFQVSGTTQVSLTWANTVKTYLAVSIDGGTLTRLPLINGTQVTGSTYPTGTQILASGLDSSKTHTIRVVVAATDIGQDRWTDLIQFRVNNITVDAGGTIQPWYPNKKRILFIGDSITDGLSVYASTFGGGNAVDNHGGDVAYPKVAADILGVISDQQGFGGSGITKAGTGGIPKAITANQYYYNTKGEQLNEPDVIVIAHHTNDGNATDTDFINGYNELINFFISKWGNQKPIFLLEVSSWGKRTLLPTIASGFSNVHFVGTIQAGLTISAPFDTIHPDVTGHQTIGNQLASEIKKVLGDNYFTTDNDTTAPVVSATPAGGTFTNSQNVVLSGTDNNNGSVTIYYTTDNSDPKTSGTKQIYSGAIPISATKTLKYYGKDDAGNESVVQTQIYTINSFTEGINALSLNGTNDYLEFNDFQFDKLEIVANLNSAGTGYIFDARAASGGVNNAYLASGFAPPATISDVQVNDAPVTKDSSTVANFPRGTKNKFTLVFSSVLNGTATTTLFSRGAAYYDTNFKCNVYSVKAYKAGVLQAHWDFTNQTAGTTITDQTGNGHNLTRHTGTYVAG